MKHFLRFSLTLFFLWLPLATNAASLEISKVNNAKLIRQFEELASLKRKPIQEIQPTLSKAAQNLLTYLAPKIKHLDGFNTTFVINCTVPFDSNNINNIKCDVDFSSIDPGNQTDPNALILRENIRELRHNNIFLTRSFLNCSSGEYLSGTNGIYFEQPWDWTRTESQSNIERSRTSLSTLSDTGSHSETESVSDDDRNSESIALNTSSGTISDTELNSTKTNTKTTSISKTQTSSRSMSSTEVISGCQKLQNISQNLNSNYILKNNIDCSDTKNWNDGVGFIPIGFSVPFSMMFDGNNYTISNLYINNTNPGISAGLFSSTTNTAVIKNIKLSNVIINSVSSVNVGTAAAIGTNSGAYISNIHIITGNIVTTGREGSAGGLIGNHYWGNITNSSFVGRINAYNNAIVGGLVGYNSLNQPGIITSSYADIKILTTSNAYIGGLAAVNEGMIINSYATGTISGVGGIGGLVGKNEGTILNSYASVTIKDSMSAGGLVGDALSGDAPGGGNIENSYATGDVSGDQAGGLIGETDFDTGSNSVIKDCYSIGNVKGNSIAGGLIGSCNNFGNGGIIRSYWNVETSGQQTSASGQGETTQEMMQKSTYVGWDFDNVWEIKEGESYPTLRWQKTKN